MHNEEEILLTTIDIAHTSVAALSRLVEAQAQLIRELTAPRPSRLPELLQMMPVIMEALHMLFAPNDPTDPVPPTVDASVTIAETKASA